MVTKKMDDPGAIIFSSSDKRGHEEMFYSDMTIPRELGIPCLKKKRYNYKTRWVNIEEGDLNF